MKQLWQHRHTSQIISYPKKNDDTAEGKITFEQGLYAGNFVKDSSGAGIWQDNQGGWHVESDYLHARRKLVAKEVQIEDVHHVGGQMLLTAAAMTCDFVVEKEDAYRCFFRRIDNDGKKVTNTWRIGDQAYVNTFNLAPKSGGVNGNHFLWRLVTDASSGDVVDPTIYIVNGEEIDASEYHYIDLSKTICADMSDAPLAGDDIVQLGNQQDGFENRQNAIVIAGAGTASPYIREYVGIHTFELPTPETQLKPGDNKLTGKVEMQPGSTMPDGKTVEQYIAELQAAQNNIESIEDAMEGLSTGKNLLRNTGFTGDYLSEEVSGGDNVESTTEIYSDGLDHWISEGVTIVTNSRSASGFSADMNGYLSQDATEDLVDEEWYCVSFQASGNNLQVSVGGYSELVTLSSTLQRYYVRFICTDTTQKNFTIQGNAVCMEIMLSRGRVANADWSPSPLDNDKTLAYYQNLAYLANAISEASTTILGGLILSQMIRVGNYRNQKMVQETGGMSGLYTSQNSPYLWGGGTMEQAIYTIMKYADNPSYQASDAEVAQMAKFVVTHGGRAILNDIILRGYIYALGGVFNGTVYANSGVFKNVHSPNGNFKIDESGNFECSNAKIGGNLFMPLFEIDSSNAHHYLVQDPNTGLFNIRLDLTGLNVQLKGDIWGGVAIGITPPMASFWNGAQMYVRNSSTSEIVFHGASGTGNLYTLQSGDFGVFFCYHASGDNYYWVKIN